MSRPNQRQPGHLLRIVGVGFGIAVAVGNTIGTGILRTPGEVAAYLGAGWMVLAVWLLGGVYALLCASSVTELGTLLPSAGGWYVYARRAFGEHTGFVVGCSDWIMQSVAIAYLAVALGEFAALFSPDLAIHTRLIALLSILALTILNWIGLKIGSRAQQLTSLAKSIALLALVVACFTITPKAAAPATLGTVRTFGQGSSLSWFLALQGVVITYDGWYAPIYFVEEDQDPVHNLPRSMIGGLLCCIAIYLLLNAALMHVLGVSHLATSQLPAAEASSRLFGDCGRQIILLISILAVVGTLNATLLVAPRILYGMARDGLIPFGLTAVNSGGTPTRALIISICASLTLALTGTFDTLIAIASVLYVSVYLSAFLALLVLRSTEPDLPRPYRAWFCPWSTLLAMVASAVFLCGSVLADIKHSALAAALILLSYGASLLWLRLRTRR